MIINISVSWTHCCVQLTDIIPQMLRKLLKLLLYPILKPLSDLYLNRTRSYSSHGLKIKVLPSVFHPGLFISTELIIAFLEDKELDGKSFLELGAGSGLVSLFAAKKGAKVTSSDISQKAIENIKINSEQNNLPLTIIHSDLFDKFPQQPFDWIFINPPFYPKNPQNEKEMAFYCGEGFEYFIRLFAQIKDFIHEKTFIYMILSEDCDLKKIESIANSEGFQWVIEEKRQKWGELNFIFRIEI